VDFSDLAKTFGLAYRLIDGTTPSGVVLEEALATNRPVLVESRVDKGESDQFRSLSADSTLIGSRKT